MGEIARKPDIVNVGPFCGNPDWFMFYCPQCTKALIGKQEECKCGCKIDWITKSEDENV